MTVGSPMGALKKRLPPALAKNIWKPGQSGNPSGLSGLYGETVKLAREAAPAAIRRLIELTASEGERVTSVACNSALERAFGKPKDYARKRMRPTALGRLGAAQPRRRDRVAAALHTLREALQASQPKPVEPEVTSPGDER